MAPSQSAMLMAIHKADPKTLSQRYTPQQVAAAYGKLGGGTAAGGAAGGAAAGTMGTTAGVQTAENTLANTAANTATANLNSTSQSQPFVFNADRQAQQAAEDAAYGRLTRGVDDQESRNREQQMQDLANRGIPYSDDPNSQYQKQLRDINNRFDTIRGNAHQDAFAAGQQNLQQQFDIASGAYNTGIAGTQAIAGLGASAAANFAQLDAQMKSTLDARAYDKWKTKYLQSHSGSGGGSNDNGFGTSDPGGTAPGGL